MTSTTLTILALTLSGAATALILARAFIDVILHAFANDPEDES